MTDNITVGGGGRSEEMVGSRKMRLMPGQIMKLKLNYKGKHLFFLSWSSFMNHQHLSPPLSIFC
jgi:hypothetical protein